MRRKLRRLVGALRGAELLGVGVGSVGDIGLVDIFVDVDDVNVDGVVQRVLILAGLP